MDVLVKGEQKNTRRRDDVNDVNDDDVNDDLEEQKALRESDGVLVDRVGRAVVARVVVGV